MRFVIPFSVLLLLPTTDLSAQDRIGPPLGASTQMARAALPLKPDRGNIVASRFMGDWVVDSSLAVRLRGRPDIGIGKLSFRSDTSVASRLPKMIVDAITAQSSDPKAYASGHVSVDGAEYPFVLISMNGNMSVLLFMPQGNDPLGNPESFLIQLAIATEPANDLLLVGGDFNSEPFTPMKRAAPRAPGM